MDRITINGIPDQNFHCSRMKDSMVEVFLHKFYINTGASLNSS